MNDMMSTDDYEFTMGSGYFEENKKDEISYFDIFFRKNPFKSGYTIMAGLDQMIETVKNIHFKEDDIAFFESKGIYSKKFLEYLKNFKFTGDIYAIPDGTPIFPNEPVVTIKGNLIETQILETVLLSHFNSASLVATAAKRITLEANKPVMEFGTRRTHSKAGVDAGKNAYLAGCIGTSNEASGERYDVPILGTMAHSWIGSFDTEYEAFLKFAKHNPHNTIFLVDTYSVLLSGIPNAIKVANDYLKPNGIPFMGIRIDSGDLAYLSKEARRMLDEAGYKDTKICVSDALTERSIKKLNKEKAIIDSYGVGDAIAAPLDRVGGVYKLVALEKMGKRIPKIKMSEEEAKTINPEYKKVYRLYDKKTGYALGDVIALAEELIPKDCLTFVNSDEIEKTITNYEIRVLQIPIFQNGKLVYQQPTIHERREYCIKQMDTLPLPVKRLTRPHQYYVGLTLELLKLKKELIMQLEQQFKPKEKSLGSL